MKKRNIRRTGAAGVALLMTAGALAAMPPCAVLAADTTVRINEVCTKNTTMPASDGQCYDFVELYNGGGAAVSLAGWGLTDDPAYPDAYAFGSDVSIPAKGYLVVYCGVKADGIPGAAFGLSKNGDTVYLTDPSGNVAETVEVPALDDDTTFGRVPDGGETLAKLSRMTPGAANPQDAVTQVAVETPKFSQESGFYNSEFQLTLTAPSGCTVYYTTDGSDPTTASTQYTGAIRVYDKTSDPNVYANEKDIASSYTPPTFNVDKAMIVRAIAVDSKGNVSNIVTNSYFVGYTDSDYAKKMCVISLVTDPANLFDYEKGIYVRGKTYDDWRSGPDYDFSTPDYFQPANYTQKGKAWERPAHMTVFENGEAKYSTGIGIRMHGGATRSADQKSFNLYARSDYGDAQMDYDFFHGSVIGEGGKIVDKFNKLTLRNGGNDKNTKLRDRLNQEMVSDRSFAVQGQTECVVFLDGEFWGTYNIVEKIDDEFIHDHYDVKASDVCIIKTDEQEEGTDAGWADYEKLKELAASGDFNNAATYQQLCDMIDIQSFADYMAAECIYANTDFGDNNYCLWKTETVNEKKTYADGKWRWVLFDTEYGQGLYGQSNASSTIFQSLERKNTWLTKLFYKLIKVQDFRKLFTINYFDLCNKNFEASRVTARIDELEQLYLASMSATYARFNWAGGTGGWGGFPGWGGGGIGGGWGGFPGIGGNPTDPTEPTEPTTPTTPTEAGDYTSNVKSEISTIRSFWQQRGSQAKNLLLNYLGSDPGNQTCTVTVTNDTSKGVVKLNTLTLDTASWSGTYPMAYELTLSGVTADGGIISGWNITGADIVTSDAATGTVTILPTANQVTIQPNYSGTTVPTVTYSKADAQKLMQYLLTKTRLTAAEAAKYDMDGNKKLDAKDLSLLKKKIGK